MMTLQNLLASLSAQPLFQALCAQMRQGQAPPDQSLPRGARPFVLAALYAHLQRPFLVVTSTPDRAYNLSEQLPVWLPQAPIIRFAEPSAPFYERAPWSEETRQARLGTLSLLQQTEPATPPLVVTSAFALMQKTLPLREFRRSARTLRVGEVHPPQKLMSLWVELGYEPASLVSQAGQFSWRGGILDVFPPSEKTPLRLEFFGEELESLRRFDPASQRSLEKLESITLAPTREALPRHGVRASAALEGWFNQQAEGLYSALNDYEALSMGMAFPLLEFYLPWMYPEAGSLLDYLSPETLVVVEDWGALRDASAELEETALAQRSEHIKAGRLAPDSPLPYHTWDALAEALSARHPLHLAQGKAPLTEDVLGVLFRPPARFGGQLRVFLEQVSQAQTSGESLLVISRQAEHLASLWSERHLPLGIRETLEAPPARGEVRFIRGELGEGWRLDGPVPLTLFSDTEIFGWQRPEPRRRPRQKAHPPEALFADLEVGAYVVHVEHGIGRFGGLVKREFRGEEREMLLLEYGGGDVLYLPIHQAERITRYLGTDDSVPKLNRLGTAEWSKVRRKAEMAAEEVAEDLLKLYAQRATCEGHAFAPDGPWQHELEASFPYVETEDQLQALREVKQDMESPRPMDRLICGDVGFGKTEIALRAAFKAVMDGKQVALLVPTTILAQQHGQTFSCRLANFPVRVETLSRFRSPEEQRAILHDLAAGRVDILIGTHRLLQPDVRFKDLGLLIIDEEQRFGLTHKEQLKHLRATVDVLTLTATPIPRTLYMGLTGLRDVSIISTPPDERLPVATYVGLFNPALVRQAILRELERGGQVYVVHNRVGTLKNLQGQLQALVPEATFAIAHGQMDERELEAVMADFTLGAKDVLLSTSIIESGLDIPNANTIIVDRADLFGLADLYQLRGRVGRSNLQAYAYFFHPAQGHLNEEARERLDILREENGLGAGYSIAMRDLELRGAGDLLGKRQSGHIAAVGFHLYTQLLTQAIQRLKAQHAIKRPASPPPSALTIDLPVAAYIPPEYIPETDLRLQLYRRLAEIDAFEELDVLVTELQDRFGALPTAVRGLLYQLKVKLLASRARATAVVYENERIGVKLPYLGKIDRYALQNDLAGQARVSRVALWMEAPRHDASWPDRLLALLQQVQVAPPLLVDEGAGGL
jgi:transcription-repair coupling factor (superfamily II helicase)